MNKKDFNELQSKVDKIKNKHERELAQGYLDTLASIKLQISEIYEKHAVDGVVAKEVWHRFGYIRKMEQQLTEQINDLTPIQNETIKESVKETFEESYYRNGYYLEQQAQLAAPVFFLLSAKAIQEVTFNPMDKIKWSDRHKKNNKALVKQLKGILRNGIKNGHSYDKMASAMTKEMGVGQRKAIKIVQTETARSHAMATQKAMETATYSGINVKKRWLSTLDSRTRDSHKHLDGQTIAVEDYFISKSGRKAQAPHGFGDPKEDINCRCRSITIFEGLEPTVRMAREVDKKMGNITTYENYPEWRQSLDNR